MKGTRATIPYTDEIGGEAAIRARYWGPTADDRRHNLVINYSYDIPSFFDAPVLKQLLSNWQISGVTKMLSGQAITPSCSSNNPGVNNSDPSLTGLGTGTDIDDVRCELTGEPLFVPYTGRSERSRGGSAALQPRGVPHAAAERQRRQLREHAGRNPAPPDLARVGHHVVPALPDQSAGRRNSGIKLQLQAYNVFNEVQFTNMNAAFTFTGPNNSQINSANTGKYTATGTGLAAGTIAPRVLGLTARVADWVRSLPLPFNTPAPTRPCARLKRRAGRRWLDRP